MPGAIENAVNKAAVGDNKITLTEANAIVAVARTSSKRPLSDVYAAVSHSGAELEARAALRLCAGLREPKMNRKDWEKCVQSCVQTPDGWAPSTLGMKKLKAPPPGLEALNQKWVKEDPDRDPVNFFEFNVGGEPAFVAKQQQDGFQRMQVSDKNGKRIDIPAKSLVPLQDDGF